MPVLAVTGRLTLHTALAMRPCLYLSSQCFGIGVYIFLGTCHECWAAQRERGSVPARGLGRDRIGDGSGVFLSFLSFAI